MTPLGPIDPNTQPKYDNANLPPIKKGLSFDFQKLHALYDPASKEKSMNPSQPSPPIGPASPIQPNDATIANAAEISQQPFVSTVPPEDPGTKAQFKKMDKKVEKLVQEYTQRMDTQIYRPAAIKNVTTKFILLAILITLSVAAAPFTFGGSLAVGALIWGGMAVGTMAFIGAAAYFGTSEYNAAKMQEVVKKLQQIGFNESDIKELSKIKQMMADLDSEKMNASGVIKELISKVDNFVTKMSISELNKMGFSDEQIAEISLQNKIHKLTEEGETDQIDKLALLLAHARNSPELEILSDGEQTEVIENYELFRAREKGDDKMPLTGRVLKDPLKYAREGLEEQQDELTSTIIQEERYVNELEGKLTKTAAKYKELKEKLIHQVLAAQVTKTFLGVDSRL